MNTATEAPTFKCEWCPNGVSVWFECPVCGRRNVHGAVPGHRGAHCPCWRPGGYYIEFDWSEEPIVGVPELVGACRAGAREIRRLLIKHPELVLRYERTLPLSRVSLVRRALKEEDGA